MTRLLRSTCLAALACGALAARAPARADDDPCASARSSYCADVKPGEARQASCLKARWGDLTPACRAYVDRLFSTAELFNLQCKPEIYDLCRAVESGKGAVLACLRSKYAQLSPTCQAAVDQAKIPD